MIYHIAVDFSFFVKTPQFCQITNYSLSHSFFIITLPVFHHSNHKVFKPLVSSYKFTNILFGSKFSNSILFFFSDFTVSKFFFFSFFQHYFSAFNRFLTSKMRRNSAMFVCSTPNVFFTVSDFSMSPTKHNFVTFNPICLFSFSFKNIFINLKYLNLVYGNTFSALI